MPPPSHRRRNLPSLSRPFSSEKVTNADHWSFLRIWCCFVSVSLIYFVVCLFDFKQFNRTVGYRSIYPILLVLFSRQISDHVYSPGSFHLHARALGGIWRKFRLFRYPIRFRILLLLLLLLIPPARARGEKKKKKKNNPAIILWAWQFLLFQCFNLAQLNLRTLSPKI